MVWFIRNKACLRTKLVKKNAMKFNLVVKWIINIRTGELGPSHLLYNICLEDSHHMPLSVFMIGGSPPKLYLCLKSTIGIPSKRKHATKYQFTIWNEGLSHIMMSFLYQGLQKMWHLVFLSPFHIKLGLMKNSVKAMTKTGIGFSYLRNTFPRLVMLNLRKIFL